MAVHSKEIAEDISPPDDNEDIPPEVRAEQRKLKQERQRELGASTQLHTEVETERRTREERIKRLYKERILNPGNRRSVVVNTENVRDRKRTRLQLLGKYKEEREYAEQHRPRQRIDCIGGERPCPWVSCRHHLALDITSNGSIQLNFPDPNPASDLPEVDLDKMLETCALDVVDKAAEDVTILEEIGLLLNITRERVRQLEQHALEVLNDARLFNPLDGLYCKPKDESISDESQIREIDFELAPDEDEEGNDDRFADLKL